MKILSPESGILHCRIDLHSSICDKSVGSLQKSCRYSQTVSKIELCFYLWSDTDGAAVRSVVEQLGTKHFRTMF